MNLMFWKKKPESTNDAEDSPTPPDDKTVALNSPDPDAPPSPGLVMRMKSGLAALVGRFRKTPTPDAEENQTQETRSRSQPDAEDVPAISQMRNKKRLIIGGAIGLLVLLLAGIGFATWKIFMHHPKQEPATAEISHTSQPASYTETPQAEIEALKKKNLELQAQIEAIKKRQPQQQPPAAPESGESTAAPSSGSGEMTISNKDPKAAAQALKAAIEEMNATSGARKPAK